MNLAAKPGIYFHKKAKGALQSRDHKYVQQHLEGKQMADINENYGKSAQLCDVLFPASAINPLQGNAAL